MLMLSSTDREWDLVEYRYALAELMDALRQFIIEDSDSLYILDQIDRLLDPQ